MKKIAKLLAGKAHTCIPLLATLVIGLPFGIVAGTFAGCVSCLVSCSGKDICYGFAGTVLGALLLAL